jgi:two-component system, OmpR family, response regulator BaeR
MSSGHVLVVEDENKLAVLLKDYLERSDFRVTCLERGDQVIPLVKQRLPDLDRKSVV